MELSRLARRETPMLKIFEAIAQDGIIHLPADVPATAHCVVTVLGGDRTALERQAALTLPDDKQRRMSDLLVRNRDGALTAAESSELDALSEEFDAATLTKGAALAALAQRKS
jgi:hypothetical protein